MNPAISAIIHSRIDYQDVSPMQLQECAITALQRVVRTFGEDAGQRQWNATLPPQPHPAVANASYLQAIAPYRFGTNTPDHTFVHRGILQLECIVRASESRGRVGHGFQLIFTNHNYYMADSYKGYEDLILATVLHLGASLRDDRLLPAEYLPFVSSEAHPIEKIASDLAHISNVFIMDTKRWKDSGIRHALESECTAWNWDVMSALLVKLQWYSLGF